MEVDDCTKIGIFVQINNNGVVVDASEESQKLKLKACCLVATQNQEETLPALEKKC